MWSNLTPVVGQTSVENRETALQSTAPAKVGLEDFFIFMAKPGIVYALTVPVAHPLQCLPDDDSPLTPIQLLVAPFFSQCCALPRPSPTPRTRGDTILRPRHHYLRLHHQQQLEE